MSKLTREVKFLQESDRPKKAEPLKFTNWCKEKYKPTNLSAWSETEYDFAAHQYATYLQEFNAEENPVEFTFAISMRGHVKSNKDPSEFDKIIYLGKCSVDGDLFAGYYNGVISFWKGHLNSGKF